MRRKKNPPTGYTTSIYIYYNTEKELDILCDYFDISKSLLVTKLVSQAYNNLQQLLSSQKEFT